MRLILFGFVFLFLAGLVFPTTNLSSCENITDDGKYLMIANFLSGDITLFDVPGWTCINIGVPNVTLDCDGHNITNNGTAGVSRAIYISPSAYNVTVKNCPDLSGYTYGLEIYGSNNHVIDNVIAHNNSMFGILLNSSNDTTLKNSKVWNNTLNVWVENSNNFNLENTHLYKSSDVDLAIVNPDPVDNIQIAMASVTFDSDAGDLETSVTIDAGDLVGPQESYSMDWDQAPALLPPDRISFDEKWLEIKDFGINPTSIDLISFSWLQDEVFDGGYNEEKFEAWQHSILWSMLDFTLDIDTNTLTINNLFPASTYGILHNGTANATYVNLYGAVLSNITSHGRFDNGTAQSNPTEGGNITGVAVSSAQLTEKWAAFYGDVVGEIVLRGATGSNYVYSWAWNATSGGAVCVSTNGTMVSPIIVGGAFGSDIDSAWSFTASDADSGTNTYNNTNCTIDIGSDTVENTSYVDTGAAGGFMTCAMRLADNPVKDEVLFCAEIISGGTAWDGGTADFELMVPTPATPGSTETYYFYANLD